MPKNKTRIKAPPEKTKQMASFDFRHAESLARHIHRCDADAILHKMPPPAQGVEELCRASIYDCELFRITGRRGFKAFISPLYCALGLELFECHTLKEMTRTHEPLLAVVDALMQRRKRAALPPAGRMWRVFMHITTNEIIARPVEDDAFAVAFRLVMYLDQQVYFSMQVFRRHIFALLYAHGARPSCASVLVFLCEERHDSLPPAFTHPEIAALCAMVSPVERNRAIACLACKNRASSDTTHARIDAVRDVLAHNTRVLHTLAHNNFVPSPLNMIRRIVIPHLDAFALDAEGRTALQRATSPTMRAFLLSLMRDQHEREAPFVRVLLLARRREGHAFACMPFDLFASIVRAPFGSFDPKKN